VRLPNTEELPPWTTVDVGYKERAGDAQTGTAVTTSGPGAAADRLDAGVREFVEKKGSNGLPRTLDDWLAEDESKEGETEEESEEETDSDEYETDSEEDDGEEDTDDDVGEQERLVVIK
jgi:hypothetical protein